MLELIDGWTSQTKRLQEWLTTKYSCQILLCINVPDSISLCDEGVEKTRTFTMNPKERTCFCPLFKPVALSEPCGSSFKVVSASDVVIC